MGLGFSLAGGVDQNNPFTVRKFLLKNIVMHCPQCLHLSLDVFFSGSQGVSFRRCSAGRLHKGRGFGLVNQWHGTAWLRPLGGPEGPETSKDSGVGSGGPEKGRD